MRSTRLPAWRSQHIALIAACIALFSSVGAHGKTRSTTTSPSAAQIEMPKPELGSGIAAPDRFALKDAFRIALARVRENPECGSLFDDLTIDGHKALDRAVYQQVRSAREFTVCRPGVVAFTSVGGNRIRLCDDFKHLSRWGKARSLIHEALHTAGLGEFPQDPQGFTPREIDGRVAVACSL